MMIYRIQPLETLAHRNEIDILAQDIARKVFQENFKDKSIIDIVPKKVEVLHNPQENIDLTPCGIRRIWFDIVYSDDPKVTCKGAFYADHKIAKATIGINIRMFGNKSYETLIQELKYTLRHELQHCKDEKDKINHEYQYSNDAERYLLDPSEINSYIRESMLQAKNSKNKDSNREKIELNWRGEYKSVEDIIRKIITDTIQEWVARDNITNPEIISQSFNKIYNTYLQKINQIYQRPQQ